MISILYTCFFFSGVSGLLFEILWTRQITREMGGAALAVSMVLTLYMAGLGAGAFWGGRISDRLASRRRLLLGAYGLAEAAAALAALCVPLSMRLWHAPLAWAYVHFAGRVFPLAMLAAAATALLPPTLFMGMSLPFLTRLCVDGQTRFGKHFGGLYAVNAGGAVLGSLLAGFAFIPDFGLSATMGIGVAINLSIAALTNVLARRREFSLQASETAQRVTGKKTVAPDAGDGNSSAAWRPAAVIAVITVAISGFCALGYEVLWTHLLTIVFGPTTYAFTVVLAAFITGLALGGFVFGRVADRVPRCLPWLAAVEGAAALLALAVGQRMGNSEVFFQKADWQYQGNFAALMAAKAVYVFALLLAPTFFFGAALPLSAKIWGRYRRSIGATAGDTYLGNTCGAVIGAWCAGFLLLPVLGMQGSLKGLGILQAALAAALVFFCLRSTEPMPTASGKSRKVPPLPVSRRVIYSAAGLTLMALASATIWPHWSLVPLATINSAKLQPEFGTASWGQAAFADPPPADPAGGQLYSYSDGLQGSVALLKDPDFLQRLQLSLFLDGKADASSRDDMFTQTLLAHFAMAVHPHPEDVMVLGLASGITAGEVLDYPVRRVDVLEINPQVVRAAAQFAPWNNNVLRDPRVHIRVQDAKAHLWLSGRRYDVIISEPSNPWMAGLAELFTREFYARARASLNPGGVMVQFIHSYQMDWRTFCLMGRTFHAVFPHSLLVRTMPDDRAVTDEASDYLLVGFPGDSAWTVVDTPARRQAMAASHNVVIADPRILYRLVAAENLDTLFGPGPLHTENHPRLEFQAPRLMFRFESSEIEKQIAQRARLTPRVQNEIASQRADPGLRLAFADYALSLYKPFPGMGDLTGAAPDQREAYARAVENYCSNNEVGDFTPFTNDPEILRRCSIDQMGILSRALTLTSSPAEIYLEMANVCAANRVWTNALKYLQAAADAAPGTNMAEYAEQQMASIQSAFSRPATAGKSPP